MVCIGIGAAFEQISEMCFPSFGNVIEAKKVTGFGAKRINLPVGTLPKRQHIAGENVDTSHFGSVSGSGNDLLHHGRDGFGLPGSAIC